MKLFSSFILSLLLTLPVVGFSMDTININTADKETLMTVIKGVGEKKAEAIIAYRNENGPFKKIEDLTEIKGIDTGIIEKNREKLTVE